MVDLFEYIFENELNNKATGFDRYVISNSNFIEDVCQLNKRWHIFGFYIHDVRVHPHNNVMPIPFDKEGYCHELVCNPSAYVREFHHGVFDYVDISFESFIFVKCSEGVEKIVLIYHLLGLV